MAALGQLSPWMTEFDSADDGRWLRAQASFPTLQKRLAKALGTSVDVYSSGPGPVRRLRFPLLDIERNPLYWDHPSESPMRFQPHLGDALVDAAAQVSVGTRVGTSSGGRGEVMYRWRARPPRHRIELSEDERRALEKTAKTQNRLIVHESRYHHISAAR